MASHKRPDKNPPRPGGRERAEVDITLVEESQSPADYLMPDAEGDLADVAYIALFATGQQISDTTMPDDFDAGTRALEVAPVLEGVMRDRRYSETPPEHAVAKRRGFKLPWYLKRRS